MARNERKPDIDELHTKAKLGELTASEAALVAERLKSRADEPATLLLILGWGNARQYEPLVAEFLTDLDDPMATETALRVLCRLWNLGTHYRSQLIRFIVSPERDGDETVRLAALEMAGYVLAQHDDSELLAALVAAFENGEETADARSSAYYGLALAQGRPPQSIPYVLNDLERGRPIDPGPVAAARARLSQSLRNRTE